MQKGMSKVVILESFSSLAASLNGLFVLLIILVNVAKSFFVYVAVHVHKIEQKGSRGAPRTAWVVLTLVCGSPRGPSGGIRGGKSPQII